MAVDLAIRGGLVVDGTGAPGRHVDVGIKAGQIVSIGKLQEGASRVIDATGLVVAPGFIDPHTHYDAQVCWDTSLSPSPWHGVTTVLMGNCGVGIAPTRAEGRIPAMQDLVNVEGMPYDVMDAGITWDWQSFPEFMRATAQRRPAANVAFLAPLTPFRYYVMGEAAIERAANDDERARIRDLLKEAVAAGAFGFSTTQLPNHMGHRGRPIACRQADRAELREYAQVLRDAGRGFIEVALTEQMSVLSDSNLEMLEFLLRESGRPVTWLALLHRDDIPQACSASLAKAAHLTSLGSVPQICARPLTRDMDLRTPHSFMSFKSWHRALNLSVEEQKRVYADPAFRNQFRQELKGPAQFTGNWELMAVAETKSPHLEHFTGQTIAAIARQQGKDGVDALLDLAIEDNLQTEFALAFLNTNQEGVASLLRTPGTVLGLSDGGAHLGVLCDAGYPTYLLGHWVRERRALSIEHAVMRLTSEPARLLGLRDRGQIAEGMAADLAIFDPATVGSDERAHKRFDLPGGAKRFVMPSRGMHYTIVGGEPVFENGEDTGARPGVHLRS
jgi:N-acyl-D-aspartate/D-glutamate deacylase